MGIFSKSVRSRLVLFVLIVPYLALAVGTEGLHRFSYKSHCHNFVADSCRSRLGNSNPLALLRLALPISLENIHDTNSCILCQWLKNLPQNLPPKGASLIFTSSEVSDTFLKALYQILSPDKKLSRAPPFVIQ